MKLIKSVWFFLLLLIPFNTYLTYAFAEKKECNQVNKLLIKNTEEIFNYQESRNDIGVFYDFAWDEKNKKSYYILWLKLEKQLLLKMV